MTPFPLIIDVDTGIDDAFALLLAAASPEARLLGVSTVAGNVDLNKATLNTRAVLALAGRSDIPVWRGCATPLLYPPADASDIHGESGLGYAVLPDPGPELEGTHAVDAILTASKAHSGELVLVATGPLTNIAAALIRDPGLPKRLRRFVIMGGAFREGGNTTPAAEFNIWHDPEAARIVFREFGVEGAAPLVAIGLDVTRKTRLVPGDIVALAAKHPSSPIIKFMQDAGRFYFDLTARRYGERIFIMHDPLAIGVAIDPSLVETVKVAADVETAGELTRGMTVADWRGVWKRPANAEVAVTVDAPRFIAMFTQAIDRLASSSVAP